MNKLSRFEANSPEARDIAHHLHPYTNPDLLKENGPQIINAGKGFMSKIMTVRPISKA